MGIENILNKLQRVKKTGASKWMACCPAHADGSPSLSIKELSDGRVLIYDFGGCEVEAVLGAIGIEMDELFPEQIDDQRRIKREKKPFTDRELISAFGKELTIAWVLLQDIASGRPIGETDRKRAAIAAQRCASVLRELNQQ